MNQVTLLSVLIFALTAASCTVDPAVQQGERCDDAGSCSPGHVCYRGFCVVDVAVCAGGADAVACSVRGADGLTPVGRCRPGSQTCTDGVPGECEGEILPLETDACDGIDDDCDGTTDEDLPTTCDTGEPGVCRDGAPACRNGTMVCARVGERGNETCNDQDDDCDGLTDEALTTSCYPAADGGCTDDDGDGVYECTGTCRAGEIRCVEGTETGCEDAVAIVMEACGVTPAADDDCDGAVDEGCPCSTGETQACYGGSDGTEGVGPCIAGTQSCVGGAFGDCEGQRVDTAETCANPGVDDDCDGTMDDIPMLGMGCMGSMPGECSLGTRACSGDVLVCDTPEPTAERCDGADDDCDGSVDEDFDVSTDAMNCGACGAACSMGSECCDSACVDTTADPMNCGGCGVTCGSGESCCGGACVDTDADAMNCGACGATCPGDCCGGTCTDVRTDATNCGSCGAGCGSSESCCGGTCASPTAPACTGCPTDCSASGESCCSGSCVDMMNDEANCGGCGTMCSPGQVCCGGSCVTSDESACGQSCAACGSSQLCCAGACVDEGPANCNACGSACPSPNSCCGDGCFNLSNDDAHCGSCDTDCTTLGQHCSSGTCCPMGQTACGGRCVDLDADNSNCGSCGHSCSALTSCSGGSCVLL